VPQLQNANERKVKLLSPLNRPNRRLFFLFLVFFIIALLIYFLIFFPFSYYLVVQGGKIIEAAQAAGKYWHAIIGRGIYESQDFKKATLEYASQL